MRTCDPQPKSLERVSIPEDLLEFLKEMNQLIEQGAEEATIESDDLMQSATAYAGLVEEDGSEYGVTYFPNHKEKGVRDKWELRFEREEIYRIAKGEIEALELWSCTDESCECRFHDKTETCFYCDWNEPEA